MPVTPLAVAFLAERGHQAVHASQVGLARASDSRILEVARSEGAVVITADLDYPRLLAAHQSPGPGLILFRGGSYSDAEMLSLLERVLNQSDEESLLNSVTVVDRNRIRRRRMPL